MLAWTNLVKSRAERFDVLGDDRGQIGVGGGGEAPWHGLNHGHHLRRQRHVREPHFFGEPAHALLVLCERVAFFFWRKISLGMANTNYEDKGNNTKQIDYIVVRVCVLIPSILDTSIDLSV